MKRTRITGRKWTESQKRFFCGNVFDTAAQPEPAEVYVEDGVTIKRYKDGYARGVSPVKLMGARA